MHTNIKHHRTSPFYVLRLAHLVILEGLLIRVTEGVKLLSVKSHTSIEPSTLPRNNIPGRVGDHRPVVR